MLGILVKPQYLLKKILRRTGKLLWWTVTLQLIKQISKYTLILAIQKLSLEIEQFSQYSIGIPLRYSFNLNEINPKIAVICHMYYLDVIDELKHYFANIPYPFDLFFTTNTDEKKKIILEKFANWEKGRVEVRLTINKGRDIAPKLITCKDVYQNYEFFLHIHSKKSPHTLKLREWRHYLLNSLIGSEEIVRSIFEQFRNNKLLGMVAPQHFADVGLARWGKNFVKAEAFLQKLQINLGLEGKLDFPSGSMFWGRSEAIKPLLDLNLSFNDFEGEKGQIDGTLGHIIERSYFFSCEVAGFQWIKISVDRDAHPHGIFLANPEATAEFIKIIPSKLLQKKEKAYFSVHDYDYAYLQKLTMKDIKFNKKITSSFNSPSCYQAYKNSEFNFLSFERFKWELTKIIGKRPGLIKFDEERYLQENSDAAEKVASGKYPCGYVHYCLVGQFTNNVDMKLITEG